MGDEQSAHPGLGVKFWLIRALMALPALGLGYLIHNSMDPSISALLDATDVTGDRIFTIRDIPCHIWRILIAPGDDYQALVATQKIGVFLEMNANTPNTFWSIVMAGFVYWIFWGCLLFALTGPDHPDAR